MAGFLILAGIVILLCIMLNGVSDKLGMPMLTVFILIGMFFGSDGISKFPLTTMCLRNRYARQNLYL